MAKQQSQHNTQFRQRTKEPQRFLVRMHNDDVTTMDFVVQVLRTVFFKSAEEATNLMLDVHRNGSAIVGIYSFDMAASKANKAMLMAKDQGFPFRLTIEPEELAF